MGQRTPRRRERRRQEEEEDITFALTARREAVCQILVVQVIISMTSSSFPLHSALLFDAFSLLPSLFPCVQNLCISIRETFCRARREEEDDDRPKETCDKERMSHETQTRTHRQTHRQTERLSLLSCVSRVSGIIIISSRRFAGNRRRVRQSRDRNKTSIAVGSGKTRKRWSSCGWESDAKS